MSLRDFSGLVRIHQWVKNLFIFMPAFFGQRLTDETSIPLILGFVSFSLSASAVYMFNDIIDLNWDRLHAQKRNRPIASGAVSGSLALVLAGFFILVSLVLAFFIHELFMVACLVYLGQNLLYSVWLKNFALIDVTIVSFGFLIRLFAGGVIAGVPVSNWMYIMTFLLAMLLALGKRREDLLIFKNKGLHVRQAVKGYSTSFINLISVMLGGVIIVAYVLYTLSPEVVARVESQHVYVTSLFVFLGVLRYLQLALVYENTGNPTLILLRDRPTQLVVIAWLLTFGYLLYS